MSNNNIPSSAAVERTATLHIELEYEGDEPGTTETTTIVAHGTEWDMRQLDARLKFLHGLERATPTGVAADPTDPGHDVETLREHVRHLERRIRQLHAEKLGAADESTRAPDGWRQYAKEGETAQACIERHRREQDRLLSLLAVARAHSQALRELVEAIDAMPSWFEVEKAARITTAFQSGKALLAAPPSGERTSAPAPEGEKHGS